MLRDSLAGPSIVGAMACPRPVVGWSPYEAPLPLSLLDNTIEPLVGIIASSNPKSLLLRITWMEVILTLST
jgi:hypothetical protein